MQHLHHFRILVSAFLILISIGNSWSQEPYKVTRISGGITFDGVPDEELWKSVAPMKIIMHSPVFRNEPTESAIIKIACDDEYFYASAVLNYKDPSTIRAIGKKRDRKPMYLTSLSLAGTTSSTAAG